MKISAAITLLAIVALVQAAPAPSGKVISEAAAASIASYQDKSSSPMASSVHHSQAGASGGDAVPMRKRGDPAVNAKVTKNKICAKAPVKANVEDVKILGGLL
ncbi:hypothetical protein EC991_005379 [Linnemannia zychae]|nr:hypothetical protein EC991_005379 [Linnemannia zychae]